MTRTRQALIAVALIASGPVAGLSSSDAAAIIAKHLDACGGLHRIKAVHLIRFIGTMTVSDESGEATGPYLLEKKRPNKSRSERTLRGERRVRGYDGLRGWRLLPGQSRPEPLPPALAKGAAEAAEFDEPLVDYELRGTAVELVGLARFDGASALKLKLTPKSGSIQYSYIDQESFLELRRDSLEADGTLLELRFKDHREIQGVVRPMRYEARQQGSTLRMTVVFIQIETNPAIPDGRFQGPP